MDNYSFKLLEPIIDGDNDFTIISDCKNSIFLAGPCPREDFSDDWRFEAFRILNNLGFTGTVITPSNKNYQTYVKSNRSKNTLEKQTTWERTAMHVASAIVFWIPRDEKHLGLTTNIEFGEWYKKPGIYVGWPENAEHVDYLGLKLKEQKKTFFNDLDSMLKAVVDDLNKQESDCFFTTDTHFKQKRTLDLSRRPFVDVMTMDMTMVSNWNKVVRMSDIVYHAGDFIDPDHIGQLRSLLSNLNFKELHWTLGNYDRKIEKDIRRIIDEYSNISGRKISLYQSGQCNVKGLKHDFIIVHEPAEIPVEFESDKIILYGHIHGRSFAKRNGFDLAADYHNYTPISMEQVEWFANAMQYWDENVYTDIAK